MAPAVLDTLRLTATFLLTHWGTLIRVSWFPVLILALSDVFFTSRILPILPALQSGDIAQIQDKLLSSLGFIVLGLVVPLVMSATAATGILRFIVLGEGSKSRSLIYIATGVPVLRVVAVTLILSLMLMLVAAVIAFIVMAFAAVLPVIVVSLPLFIFLGLTAVGSRWLLAYPSAASGGRIDLEAAWHLTKPAYSRILMLVLIVAGVIGMVAGVSGLLQAMLVPFPKGAPEAAAKALQDNWLPVTLLSFASNLFATLCFFTLLGIVYRLQVRQRERPPTTPLAPTTQPDEPRH